MNTKRIILCSGLVGVMSIGAPGVLREPDEPVSKHEPLPTLDELLGLDDASDQSDPSNHSGQIIEDANDAALDQALSPKQAGQAFSQAVSLMNQVALRIEEHNDLSVITQRLQEDILRKLDQVIESASNNQQGSGGSSSSKSSSSNQQQPDQQQQQQGPGQQGQPSDQPGDSSMPAPGAQANPGDEIAPNGVRWGALPKRIRDALSQGISDQYSELYRAITEQYYKSLAEDE